MSRSETNNISALPKPASLSDGGDGCSGEGLHGRILRGKFVTMSNWSGLKRGDILFALIRKIHFKFFIITCLDDRKRSNRCVSMSEITGTLKCIQL